MAPKTVDFAALRQIHEKGLLDDAQLGIFLEKLSSRCSSIFRYFSIGLSEHGRQMWAARLTNNPEASESKPEFLYLGNIHGDETFGRELLIHLVLDICDRYHAGDAHTRWLVHETDIYVVFSANPDGYHMSTRYNYNGVDLNRNFPDQVTRNSAPLQAETRNVMNFLQQHSFSLGANLHAGILVCNYPWDDISTGEFQTNVPSFSPDDDLYQHLCSVYSRSHGYMSHGTKFNGGITNGAAFYAMFGGLQDYAYSQLGMMHVTLELGYEKNPPISKISNDWVANKRALYNFIEQVHYGVKGHVTCSCGDFAGSHPANATLSFQAQSSSIPSRPPLAQVIYTRTRPDLGYYHRVLLPGTYMVSVQGCGGAALEGQPVVVPHMTAIGSNDSFATAAITVDFNLHQRHCPIKTQVKASLFPTSVAQRFSETAVDYTFASMLLIALLGMLAVAGMFRRHRRRQLTHAMAGIPHDGTGDHLAPLHVAE